MLKKFLFLIPPLACLFFASSAYAASDTEIKDLFCPDMQNEALYDRNEFESYKVLIPGEDGWLYRSESDLRQDFSLDDEAQKNLERLNQAMANSGTELVILLVPTRGMMHPNHIQQEHLEKYHYDVSQAWKSYRAAADTIAALGVNVVTIDRPESEIPFFNKRDHHWSPDGAKIAAQKVAAYVKDMPEYEGIEKVDYITKSAGEYEFDGVSGKVFETLCNTVQPPEYIDRQYTEPVEEASGKDALFGAPEKPEIVLAGTSNSTQIPSYANFEGFLKDALSTDVLNMSVSGGGLDTAMLSYFKSDFYKSSPAKILIWEIPAYYDLSNHKQFFQEVTPLVYGSCEDNALVSAENMKLTKNSELIFNQLEEYNITGPDYYVYVKFSEPVSGAFKLDLRYKGNRDRFRFKPLRGDFAAGPYVMILREDKKEILSKLVVWSPNENLGATADVYICKARTDMEPNSGEGVSSVLDKVKNLFDRKAHKK